MPASERNHIILLTINTADCGMIFLGTKLLGTSMDCSVHFKRHALILCEIT
jgi:hypothetical protein